MKRAIFSAVTAAFLLSGCSTISTDPEHVDKDFGNSVNQMISGQLYDKNSPRTTETSNGMDGVRGEAVLKKQRESVGNPSDVDQQVQIKVSP